MAAVSITSRRQSHLSEPQIRLRESTVRKKARDSYGKKTNQEKALQSGSHIQPRPFKPEISSGTDLISYHQEIGFLLIGGRLEVRNVSGGRTKIQTQLFLAPKLSRFLRSENYSDYYLVLRSTCLANLMLITKARFNRKILLSGCDRTRCQQVLRHQAETGGTCTSALCRWAFPHVTTVTHHTLPPY
jgi:hypothetical protein